MDVNAIDCARAPSALQQCGVWSGLACCRCKNKKKRRRRCSMCHKCTSASDARRLRAGERVSATHSTARSTATQSTSLIIVNDVFFNVPAALHTRAFRRSGARVHPSSDDCGQVSRRALHCTQRSTQPPPPHADSRACSLQPRATGVVQCTSASDARRLREGERARAALQAAQRHSPSPPSLLMMFSLTCLQLCIDARAGERTRASFSDTAATATLAGAA